VSERHSSSIISKMNNRFSLFAHVVEGNDVMDLLRPGDVLLSADVKEGEGTGAWELTRASDIDYLPFDDE
jgi:hypothetical protein